MLASLSSMLISADSLCEMQCVAACSPWQPCHCVYAGSAFLATSVPTPHPAPGSSAPPMAAAYPGSVPVDPLMPASSAVPAAVPVTAHASSVPAAAAAATYGAATAEVVAVSVHARSACKEGEAGSMPEGAEVSLPDEEGAQRTKRSSRPNPRYAMDA